MLPHVTVIGAGLAGLTVAYRLKQKGFSVDLYEAKARVGGRVFTVDLAGQPVELGGQNVLDGGDANHLQALIQEFNLQVETFSSLHHLTYFDGQQFHDPHRLLDDFKFTKEKLKPLLEKICQQATTMQEVLKALFADHEMLYQTFSVKLAAYEGAAVEKLSTIYCETLYHMLLGGLSKAHQGSGRDKTYIEHMWIRGGNALLAEKLAKALQTSIHLNLALKLIKKRGSQYELTFRNGHCIQTDMVVLAVPCGVYRDVEISDDVIDQQKLEHIQAVAYGSNSKIVVPVKEATEEMEQYTNGRMISFFNASLERLNLYYIGKYGEFSQETIEETFKQELSLLKRVYTIPSSQKAPQVAKDKNFNSYQGPVGYSWPKDPYTQGSYSCVAAGQESILTAVFEEKGEAVKALFRPIDGRLYFAGEHTSTLIDVGGTMEAAVESGEKTARLIQKHLNLL